MRMRALHEIMRPSGQVRATGEKDDKEEPVFQIIPDTIECGSIFEPHDEAQAQELLEAGAARWVEKGEEALAAIDPDAEEEEEIGAAFVLHSGPSPRDRVTEAELAEMEDLL